MRSRNWTGACAVALAAAAWGVEVRERDGRLAFFEDGAAAPFAEMARPADAELRVEAAPGRPFVVLEAWPKAAAAAREVARVTLPPLELGVGYAPAKMKALGTAGLTAVDGHSGSYMFLALAEPVTRRGVVAAWLTSRHASGIVFSGVQEGRVRVTPEMQYGRLPLGPSEDARGRGETFVVGAFDDCRRGLEAYADAVAAAFRVKMKPQIAGFCTWYSNQHGGAGDAASTRAFAACAEEKLKDWGFGFFQIDDLWQLGCKTNGPAKNFTGVRPDGPYPAGMKPTADDLRARGIVPGIWFMPFAGSQLDPYYADKQDWFVKSAIDYPPPGQRNTRRFKGIDQKKGAPYETFWGGTSLDMTDKAVERYVRDVVSRISHDWGYKYFKYDGTWTAMACEQLYVNDGYLPDDLGLQLFDDRSKTNVEVFRKGLRMVRDAGGEDVFILSCNVSQNMRTMGAAYGLVDAMRIGPDNGAGWDALCRGPVRGTARYFYNGRVWYNDPDPVYVRDSIPLAHAQTICSWAALSGQLYAFSDWLPGLSEVRVDVLRRTMAPHRRYAEARPVDLFESKLANVWSLGEGESRVFGVFNWERRQTLHVDYPAAYAGLDPEQTYVGYDFWNRVWVRPFKGAFRTDLDPTSCRVIAVAPYGARPVLVSTSHHVCAPLLGVRGVAWDAAARTLSGEVDAVKGERYELRVALPPGLRFEGLEVSEGAVRAGAPARGPALEVAFDAARTGAVKWAIRFARTDEGADWGTAPVAKPVEEWTPPEKVSVPPLPPEPEAALSGLKPVKAVSGWGGVRIDRAVSGNPLTVQGVRHARGVGVHAKSLLVYDVPKGMRRFVATAGLDDHHAARKEGSVVARVFADVCEMGEPPALLAQSPVLSDETVRLWHFDVPLDGRVKQIRLEIDDAGDGISCDHADWVRCGFRGK